MFLFSVYRNEKTMKLYTSCSTFELLKKVYKFQYSLHYFTSTHSAFLLFKCINIINIC